MAADARLLEVMSQRGQMEVIYFEAVILRVEDSSWLSAFGGGTVNEPPRKIFFCVCKHGVLLMRYNMSSVLKGGKIPYGCIEQVLEDPEGTMDNTALSIELNDSRPDSVPSKLLLTSENRATLINHLAVSYGADRMFQLGCVVHLDRGENRQRALEQHPSTISRRNLAVMPFEGFKEAFISDYRFFLQKGFEASGDRKETEFAPKTTEFRRIVEVASKQYRQTDLSVHAYDPMPLAQLGSINREHVRWLAMEYKQALIRNQETYVIRDQLYLKKMNLSNDICAWSGWELLLREKIHGEVRSTVVLLLRRQYIPPLVDSVQDFVFIARANHSRDDWDKDLMHDVRLVADSLGPRTQNPSVHQELVQAKLDALLYDEEAYGWIRSRLRLKPDGESALEKHAYIFVRGILKILQDESVLAVPDLWDEINRRVAALCVHTSEGDLDPLVVGTQSLELPLEWWVHNREQVDGNKVDKRLMYAWQTRVARYLAFCADGGLLGSRLTLADIITNLTNNTVSREGAKSLAGILSYLLHLRPKDLTKPWEPKSMHTQLHQLSNMGLNGFDRSGHVAGGHTSGYVLAGDAGRESPMDAKAYIFNDRVMQVMLEMGHLQQLFSADVRAKVDGRTMSMEFASLLNYLLLSEAASVNLKASICRQIIAAKDVDEAFAVCPGLMHLMRMGGLFLATYATAALTNLSQAKDAVKNYLMNARIAEMCVQQLRSRDDDLSLYTLMLLVHLTKRIHHRLVMKQIGLLRVLDDILSASYAVVTFIASKRRVVTELCSVLGQLCNDEAVRNAACEKYHFIAMLLDTFSEIHKQTHDSHGERSAGSRLPQASAKILSKVMFVLRQLAIYSGSNKDQIGSRVLKLVLKDLGYGANVDYQDWATNAVMLVEQLAVSKNNCQLMSEGVWGPAFQTLSSSGLGKQDVMRDRIWHIKELMAEFED